MARRQDLKVPNIEIGTSLSFMGCTKNLTLSLITVILTHRAAMCPNAYYLLFYLSNA